MDLTNMNEEILFEEYEKKFRKMAYELTSKRRLLEDCRKKLNESLIKQSELERELINEKHKNTNDNIQNTILLNAHEVLEEERKKITREIVSLKVQRDLAVVERDSLRDQNRRLASESFNYKQQINDLDSKNRCHLQYQGQVKEQMNKINGSLVQVNQTFDMLNKNQMSLKKFDEFVVKNKDLVLAANQANLMRTMAEQEKEEIEDRLINKTAEISKLMEMFNKVTFEDPWENDSILDHWKKIVKDLQIQLQMEKEGTENLTSVVKKSMEIEKDLRDKLKKQEERIMELENKAAVEKN